MSELRNARSLHVSSHFSLPPLLLTGCGWLWQAALANELKQVQDKLYETNQTLDRVLLSTQVN